MKNLSDGIREFYGIPTGNPELKKWLAVQRWRPVKGPKTIDLVLKAELAKLSVAPGTYFTSGAK